ncbi:VOC family protein [Corynebacterium sp. HMSC29G08]|uniref:VOC family protein n=1 Tax=Corynebacterium sp. HMSC29G08 TaxID=1581069 RepID=UPI0008A35CDA|nr:VOC family protein [Corynebacterium sp. HMSC29G08]OFT86223.1 hypothetical protein HMPREF3101_00400 [Corynebacterium sp. HMSC29G08]
MQITNLNRVGVVVYDLDQRKIDYERIYGITEWDEQTWEPEHSVAHGRTLHKTPGVWRSAVGTASFNAGESGPGGEAYGVTFELIQPISGESIFNEHLRTYREGIAFIQVAADKPEKAAEHFDKLDITPAYTATQNGQTRTFFDTRKALGGFCVEVAGEGQRGASTSEKLIALQGIFHFGVLVHDVMDTLPAYRDIFGITEFPMKTWETGFGRLDAPQYRGTKMDHGYFTAQGMVGNFGFEIIQSNHGDSHYNREFFDERGPGIHHFFGRLCPDDADWDATVARMTDAGHPLVMGSTLRGEAAEFGYFDTFEALGGYLIEIVVRRRTPEPQFMEPDWIVDFEELA